jgi:hypothetical protein
MTFFAAIWHNLKNWAAEYTILPLTLLSVIGAGYFAYFLTGRAPQESAGWLVDYASRCIVIALAITFTSASRQAYGTWYTKEEKLAHPGIAGLQSLISLAVLLAFLYVLKN